MKQKRTYAAVDGRGIISVEEGPIPEPKPGQVQVKVHASLISPGTELSGVIEKRKRPDTSKPKRPFGYANAGEVISLGQECADLKVGTRVACMGAGYALHASHVCVPCNLCVPIPEEVTYQEATFGHLAATSLQAIRRAELQLGENVAVLGLGIIGQLCCQIVKLAGCRVIGWDRLPLRLDKAQANGADQVINVDEQEPVKTTIEFARGYGIDAGIICFGGEATKALDQLAQTMKTAPDTHKMGRIVIVGAAKISYTFPTALGNIDIRPSSRTGPGYHDEAWEHGRDYPSVFVQWTTKRNLEETLLWIKTKGLNVKSLITDEVPLDKAPEVCDKLIEHPDQALGVVLIP